MEDYAANFDLYAKNIETRFASTNDEDISELLDQRRSKNTKRSTNRYVSLFRAYLKDKKLDTNFEEFEKDKLLFMFMLICGKRREQNTKKKSSAQKIRQGRYIKEQNGIDITSDDFSDANNVFQAKMVNLV